MRKISWLLLCFIVFSLLLTLPAGCYAKTSTILASTWHGGKPFPYLELEAVTQITQYIFDCSVLSGYTSYNWFGSETTEDHIFDAAEGVGDAYSISFFIGHGDTEHVGRPFAERQLWIYDSDGNRVYDREIYPHSEPQNVRFVFLWSCKQGKTIGGTHFWSGIHYGMPYAWLHTTDLSADGYANPDNNGYCFIGIDGDSPSILEEFDGRYAAFYYFIGHFYSAALCGDKTINEALDYASQEVWQVNFGQSLPYNGFEWESEGETSSGQMVVYGDGNLNVGKSVTAFTLPPPPRQVLTISAMAGGTTSPPPGTYEYLPGASVTVTAIAIWDDWEFKSWYRDQYEENRQTYHDNPVTFEMDDDHTLTAYFEYLGGGGGGDPMPCPTLFAWNGSDYDDLGVIDIHADEDVVREVSVPPESVGVNEHKAQFCLREGWEGLTYSHSEIDQVKLHVVDSDGNWRLCPLVYATHSELGNVLPQLLQSDDTHIDLYLLETIDLEFVVPWQTDEIEDFAFVIEGCNMVKR